MAPGMAGRPPKPPHLKIIRGGAKKKLAAKAPKLKAGRPEMPEKVATDPIARQKWEELLVDLWAPGAQVLTKSDGHALAQAVIMFANFRRAQDVIDEHGFTYEMEMKNGGTMPVQRPEVAIAYKFEAEYLKYLDRFGLSPIMRTKVTRIDEETEADPARAFLS